METCEVALSFNHAVSNLTNIVSVVSFEVLADGNV